MIGADEILDDLAILDSDSAMRALGLGPAEFDVIFAAAMDEMQSRLSQVQNAIREGHFAEIALHAHTVKSTAGAIGAERLGVFAARLLAAARAGDLPGCAAGGALALQAYEALRAAACRC